MVPERLVEEPLAPKPQREEGRLQRVGERHEPPLQARVVLVHHRAPVLVFRLFTVIKWPERKC
jgi:hypothetical protein